MPLLKRKTVDLVAPPRREDMEDDEAAVFYIERTGEIFIDYEDYVQRMSFYRQRIFQCELSGRIHLNYFEALKSERKEAALVHRNFPEALKAPILRSVQFMVTGRIDELVDMIFDRFKDRFFADETVILDIHGDKFPAAVRKVFPSRNLIKRHEEALAGPSTKAVKVEANGDVKAEDASDSGLSDAPMEGVEGRAEIKLDPNVIAHQIGTDLKLDAKEVMKEDHPIDDYLYSIQLLSADGEDDFSMALMERRADTLTRDRVSFSKTILRKYLKDCLTRDASVGSPWFVKPILAKKYGIPQKASEDVEAANEKIKEDKLQKRRKYLDENPDGSNKKPKMSKADKAKLDAERKEEEERRKAEERRKRMIKYPIEDLQLDPVTEEEVAKSIKNEQPTRRVQRPIPSTHLLPVEKELFEPLMNTYLFLQACAKALLLSPFHLDEFVDALKHTSPDPACHLIAEVHAAVLNVIVRDVSNAKVPTLKKAKAADVEEDEFDEDNNESEEEEEEEEMVDDDDEEEEDELDELDSKASSVAGTEIESSEEQEEEGEGGEEGDEAEKPAKRLGEEVYAAGRKMGRGWEGKVLRADNFRSGWEYSLCGVLTKRADPAHFARGLPVLSHLTGVGDFATDTVKREDRPANLRSADNDMYQTPVHRYPTLSVQDKVLTLQFLCEQAVMTRSIRRFFDQCEAHLTVLRKERVELNRARRKLADDRAAFEEGLKKDEEEEEGEDGPTEEGEDQDTEADGDTASDGKPINGHGKKGKKSNGVANAKAKANGKKKAGKASHDEEAEEEDEEDDEMASTGAPPSEDDYDSSGTADLDRRKNQFGSRQEAMRIKALQREAEEAERAARIRQEREETKARQMENRQIAQERKKLDDEEARILKREEAIEREFRQHSQAPRLQPLGRDRFMDKYWWFDGVGAANLLGTHGQVQYSTGRLFVQGASSEEWTYFVDEHGNTLQGGLEALEARREKEVGKEGQLGHDQWAVYTEPEEIEALMTWLRAKGVRELALRQQFQRFQGYLRGGMQKRNHDLLGGFKDNVETRRSHRTKDGAASRPPYMNYRNTFAKGV